MESIKVDILKKKKRHRGSVGSVIYVEAVKVENSPKMSDSLSHGWFLFSGKKAFDSS